MSYTLYEEMTIYLSLRDLTFTIEPRNRLLSINKMIDC